MTTLKELQDASNTFNELDCAMCAIKEKRDAALIIFIALLKNTDATVRKVYYYGDKQNIA